MLSYAKPQYIRYNHHKKLLRFKWGQGTDMWPHLSIKGAPELGPRKPRAAQDTAWNSPQLHFFS